MKLYYLAGACSMADHIALEWAGLPYETHKLSHGDTKQDWYLQLNPAGAVPALEVDGWVLTENVAILNYIADRSPQSGLGGDGSPESRAEINRWLAFVNSDMHPAFKPLFGATSYLEDDAAIEKTKAHAKATLRRQFETVDRQLQGRDWLAGSRSIADPYLYVLLRWARGAKIDLDGLDNLGAFFQRMHDDPAVAKVAQAEGLA